METRKGQVALFVAVGIVLVIGVLLFLFLRLRTAVEPTLPVEFAPVQDHVHECLRQTAIDGLKVLASHGGYLDPLDAANAGRDLVLNPFTPTESDLVRLNPADNASAIPYYYYLAGSDTCQFCLLTTLTPSQEQLESRLRTYILAHLHECINFGLFPDITVRADPAQDLTVRMTNQSVYLDYNRKLDLTKDASTVHADLFQERVDIPFLRYYALAKQITQREIDTQFLENYLLYLISAYSGIKAELPPIAGYEEGFSPSFWVLPTVRQTYQQLLISMTPSLQVLGTKGATVPATTGDPYVDGFLNMVRLDLVNDSRIKADDLSVSILEPDLPIYLDVNPKKGMLIKPRSERQSGVLFVPPRQQNYYDFYYDISAPFIVEIRQTDAIPGTDISFLFALEANVRENKNMAQWLLGRGTIPWSDDFVQYTVKNPASALPPSESGYVANAAQYSHNTSLTTLLCDDALWSVPVKVKTFDAANGRALENVTFSYACGLYATCDVGLSAEDGRYASLDTKLPQCQGGLLKAEKEGYQSVSARVSTRNGQSVVLPDMSLYPYKTIEVSFVKYQVHKNAVTDALSVGSPEPIDTSKETVFAMLNRYDQTGSEGPVTGTVIYSNDTNITTISIVPGRYEIRAFYLNNEGFVIHKGCKHIHGHAVPENDTEIKPAPWGGLERTNETSYWLVQKDDLYGHETLTIPVFVAPPPVCIDDLDSMGDTKLFSRRFRSEAEPAFS